MAAIYKFDSKLRNRRWIWWPLGALWLVFLPNTAYLLTEWRHFLEYVVNSPGEVRAAEYDSYALIDFLSLSTFYVVYSGAGLLAFAMSIWPIERMCKPGPFAKAAFFFLCAIGVYLGLIRRLNTWDVLYHPRRVLVAAIDATQHPVVFALMIGFAAVMWLTYWIFGVFVDGLRMRLRAIRSG